MRLVREMYHRPGGENIMRAKTYGIFAVAAVMLCGCSALSPTVETVPPAIEIETEINTSEAETTNAVSILIPETTTQAPTEEPTTVATETTADPNVVIIDIPTEPVVPVSTSGRMEAFNMTYSKNNVTINYPVIVGMTDEEVQSWANDEIYNDMLKILDIYGVDVKSDTLDIDYETKVIYKSEFAFIYTGTLTQASTGEKIYIKLTEDLNLNRKTHMRLSDRLSETKIVDSVITNNDYEVLYTSVGADTLRTYLAGRGEAFYSDLRDNADFGGDELPEAFSYASNGSVVMIIKLPHSLGDYAEISIKQQTK